MQNKATVFFKGGKKVYTFPFPYLSKQFVKARWDKTNSSVLLEYNRDYTIEGQNLTLVQEGSAEDTLCIYRQTPTDSLVDFNDGSILLASELDKMSVQLLHVAEEQNDSIHLSGMFAEDDAWQARGFRIKNLGNPVEPTDAVTLDYLNSIGVAHVDELQRIEKHIEHVAEEVKQSQAVTNIYSDAAFESATEAKERAQWAKDAANKVLDETIRNRAIQDEITKQKRAVDEKADEARDFRDEAEAAAATAQQAAQGANTSANSAGASAAAAAESAKKAAASAGFEGLVTTDIIKDGAVTEGKLETKIQRQLKRLSHTEAPAYSSVINRPASTERKKGNKTVYDMCVLNKINTPCMLVLMFMTDGSKIIVQTLPSWLLKTSFDLSTYTPDNSPSPITPTYQYIMGNNVVWITRTAPDVYKIISSSPQDLAILEVLQCTY